MTANVIPFIFVDQHGCIVRSGMRQEGLLPDPGPGQTLIAGVSAQAGGPQYWDHASETLMTKPPPPSQHHDWNWTAKAWEPNVEAAKTARRADVDRAMIAATLAPIDYDGSPFDADETARARISGTIARLARGDGLPTGWVGWRDADNQQHWAADLPLVVQAHLHALSAAIEDREQALLIAAWTAKAQIDALTTVEDVLAYEVALGGTI